MQSNLNPAFVMAEAQEREIAHAEALAENEAHDAAMSMAITLPMELLPLIGVRVRQMPQTLRTQIAYARHMVTIPPQRLA